jgi:hypothetical protein
MKIASMVMDTYLTTSCGTLVAALQRLGTADYCASLRDVQGDTSTADSEISLALRHHEQTLHAGLSLNLKRLGTTR